MRSDLLIAAASRSSFTRGKSLGGQRVTSAAGSLSLEPMRGSSLAAGATLIWLPDPCRAGVPHQPPAPQVPGAAARRWIGVS